MELERFRNKIIWTAEADALLLEMYKDEVRPWTTPAMGKVFGIGAENIRSRLKHLLGEDLRRRYWSPEETAELIELRQNQGWTVAAIARHFKRTPEGVATKLTCIGLGPREDGEITNELRLMRRKATEGSTALCAAILHHHPAGHFDLTPSIRMVEARWQAKGQGTDVSRIDHMVLTAYDAAQRRVA